MVEWWKKWIGYKEDHLALFTFHTLGHITTGVIIGFATEGLQPLEAAYTALGINISWEVFEYWHAPAFGYWTVMNAGNTAMDMATLLFAFMLAHGGDWDFVWCTFALLGAGMARKARSPPYEPKDLDNRPEWPKVGCNRRALEWFRQVRKSRYPKGPDDKSRLKVKGEKDHTVYDWLDRYMKPSKAHWVLAGISLVSLVVCYWAPRQVVPALAGFTLGYALAQPTDTTTKTEVDIYQQWLTTNAETPSLPPLAQCRLIF